MADENSPANDVVNDGVAATGRSRTFTVTLKPSKQAGNVLVAEEEKPQPETTDDQRLRFFAQQREAYQAFQKQVFPIESLRSQFVELARFRVAQSLDKRGIPEMDALYTGFDHLYVVDDLIKQIRADLPAHQRFGWLINSAGRNHLNLPHANGANQPPDALANHNSITCYALTQFGVASYTNDRSVFLGNIAGYLFASYFCAHLKLGYSVTPLSQGKVKGYTYLTPNVETNTRHVQNLSLVTKKKIYQLAVFCAQVSLFSVNKAIEKMLIADVNDFDKKKEQAILTDLLRYGG